MENAGSQRRNILTFPYSRQSRSHHYVHISSPGIPTFPGLRAFKSGSRTHSRWDIVRRLGVRWYGCTFIILLGCLAGFSFVLWLEMSQSWGAKGDKLPSSGAQQIHTGILSGHIIQVDPPTGIMNVTWIVEDCSTNTTTPTTPPCTNSDYFFNSNAWDLLHGGDPAPDIAYRAVNSGPDPAYDWYDPTFTTVIPMRTAYFEVDDWTRTDQAYPFDRYISRTFYTSRFTDNNQIASVGGVYLFGNVPTFTFSVVSESYRNNATSETLLWTTDIVFIRSGSTKSFCGIIVIINWLITLAVAWLTWTTVIGRRRIARQLYNVPLTALFAIPPLRGAMPGVPVGYSMIDYLGTIPNVVVIGLCTIMMILSSLIRDVDGLYPLHMAELDLADLEDHQDI